MGKSKISKEAKSTSSLLKKKLSLKKKKKFKDVNSIASPTAVVPAQKGLKRKRIMGPCPDIQLRIGADEFIPDIGDENDGGDKIVEEEEMHIENDVDVEAVQEEDMHMETDFSDKIVEEEEMHVENDGDLDVVEEDEIQATKPTKKRKSNKVRGRSVMKGLGLKFKKAKKVRFNQNDQPVGKNSVKLSSFLGVLVRRKLSLNNRDWRKVKQEVKDNLWAAVKQRFIIDDYYKPYYVGKMGCLLKDARSRTAKLVFAAYLLDEEERNQKLDIAKPDNMTSCEWEEFIEYVRSPAFKVKRRVMQEVRENHNTPHTISRKGFARLEDELKKKRNIPKEEQIDEVELWKIAHKQRKGKKPNVGVQQALEKLKKLEEENGQSGSSSKDLLSKAFGEERPGRVRGKGYGVTRTKLSLQSKIQEQCNKTIKELRDFVGVLSNKVEMLEQKDSTTKVGSPSIRVGTPNSGVASNNNLVSPSGGSPSPGGGSPNCRPNVVKVPKNGQACKILSWYNEGEVVADGTIHEVNPLKKVHGMPIGIGAYSVFVNFALEPDALLYKPWSDFRCVKDVIGTTVAWHKDFISF